MVQTDGMAGEARTGRFWEVFVRDSGGRGAGLSMSNGELVMYQTEDGLAQISLTAIDGTVWLTQDEIGVPFDKSRSTVAEHIQNIFSESELDEGSVCRNFRRTAKDGKDYSVLHYNLVMILAVSFRVRSPRGMQFRRWANTILKEYLVKGFALDDELLKQAEKWDYFDEWHARIRDIRASEKRFYQKVGESIGRVFTIHSVMHPRSLVSPSLQVNRLPT